MSWTEIKLDTTTLPSDGSEVLFRLDDAITRRGTYLQGEEHFYVSPEEWYPQHLVMQWQYVNQLISQ